MQRHTWMLGGCVEEWHIPSVAVQLWGSFLNPRNITTTAWCRPLSHAWSADVIGSTLTYGFSVTVLLLYTSTWHPVAHIKFYHAFPHVSTASNQCWSKKAWVWGYRGSAFYCHLLHPYVTSPDRDTAHWKSPFHFRYTTCGYCAFSGK